MKAMLAALLLALVGSTPCATPAASALRTAEVAKIAAALQCPAARGVVSMPCPNATNLPIVHMHVPKTGGRALKQDLVDVLGRGSCRGGVLLAAAASGASRVAGPSADRPCFVSTESRWDRALDKAAAAPVVVTMLRGAVPWALSAMEHSRQHAHGPAVDAVVGNGCFAPGAARAACGLFQPLRDFVPRRLDGDRNCPPELAVARARLESTVFGVTEHYAASLCLIRFQFGGGLAHGCDCRNASRGGDDAGARAAARNAQACQRGDHLACAKADDALKLRVESAAAIARAMTTHEALYARALDVFLARVGVVEAATGVRLVCDAALDAGADADWDDRPDRGWGRRLVAARPNGGKHRHGRRHSSRAKQAMTHRRAPTMEEHMPNGHLETNGKCLREPIYKYAPIAKQWESPSYVQTCRLMVVMASSPRSGSTLQTKILRNMLKLTAAENKMSFANLGYWNACRHNIASGNCSHTDKHVDIILTKSHEFVHNLTRQCHQQVTFMVNRSAYDRVQSYKKLNWGTKEDWDEWDVWEQCWVSNSRAVVMHPFEDFLHDKAGVISWYLDMVRRFMRVAPKPKNWLMHVFASEANKLFPATSHKHS